MFTASISDPIRILWKLSNYHPAHCIYILENSDWRYHSEKKDLYYIFSRNFNMLIRLQLIQKKEDRYKKIHQ